MKNISNISTLFILSTLIVSTLNIPPALSSECTTGDSNGHCVKVSKDKQVPSSSRKGNKSENNTQDLVKANSTPSGSAISPEEAVQKWNEEHPLQLDGAKQEYHASSAKARKAGDAECHTKGDQRPGHYVIGSLPQGDNANKIPNHVGGRYCVPNDTKTLTSNNPEQPKGPSPEEMLQEIEDKFANTDIRPPILKQSYNSGNGTGRAKGDPNIYKGDNVNFYAEAPTAYWEGELSAGHVEIESYPVQMTVQYGNGDEGTSYTIGEPIYPKSGSKARPTATSYVYKRSGNFHAYATVSYAGRYRVNGGPWQAMRTVVKKDTADPLLIRVWWVDVGRVGGTCDEDDTRWGCKNDPTMGKKDNPNPRLRKADIRTGQRWHLNDNGDGDTEYSLHRDWPDM